MSCNFYNVTIQQTDLDNAVNNSNPFNDGRVFIQYNDCNGVPSVNSYTIAGVYPDDFCSDNSLISSYYFNNDGLVAGTSLSQQSGVCGVTTTTTTEAPTTTTTSTSTTTTTTQQPSCNITTYCISNTGDALLNDTYLSGGTHNGEPFYSGTTNGYVIYYTTSNQWCLSDVLDGTCFLSGKFPCTSLCPDINSEYLSSGVCPTTTTTTTIDCSVLDFEAIFDCDITTTTTSTTTSTTTTTTTTIPPDPCSGTSVDATIQILPTTTTTTSSTTTTTTLPVDRPCVFSGDVTFNTIMGEIICPYSFEFQDCFNGMKYLTTSQIVNPSGGTIDEFMVFKADVNGETKCISYVGINLTEIGGDIITLTDGPYGFSNLGECILCDPDE